MPTVTSPRQLGYTQQRDAGGRFGRYGGQGNRSSLYYYAAGEARRVTNMRTGQVTRGGGAVASAIENAARNANRRRNRGVQGVRLS